MSDLAVRATIVVGFLDEDELDRVWRLIADAGPVKGFLSIRPSCWDDKGPAGLDDLVVTARDLKDRDRG